MIKPFIIAVIIVSISTNVNAIRPDINQLKTDIDIVIDTKNITFQENRNNNIGINIVNNVTIDCGNGIMNPATLLCVCFNDYTTYDAQVNQFCNYKQKSQMTAFWLSFFLMNFGGARFYIGNIEIAVGQLCYTIGFCFIMCFFALCLSSFSCSDENINTLFHILKGFWAIGLVIWWLYEIIMFGKNDITDNNGVSLYAW
jgi:hypothetical protein